MKPDENPRNDEEIIIPPEKRILNFKQNERSIIKMERYKISKLLNHSAGSRFVTKKKKKKKKWIQVNVLSSGQQSVNKN